MIVCFSVRREARGQPSAAEMAASEQRLPGGDEKRKPGEGMRRGDLQLRGGTRSLRRRRPDGQTKFKCCLTQDTESLRVSSGLLVFQTLKI